MQNATKEEYLASLRRRSSGFSRGVSKYRGVARYIYFYRKCSFFANLCFLNLGTINMSNHTTFEIRRLNFGVFFFVL